MNTFPHCRSGYQTESPAPCQLKAYRVEPSPEGGCPSRSAAAGADSRAGAPPEDAPTTIEDRPSCLCVASFPPSVSATVSEQNEFLSTSRSRRSRQFIKWGLTGRGGAGPPSRRLWRRLPSALSCQSSVGKMTPRPSDQ
jgi:hypothetical protein